MISVENRGNSDGVGFGGVGEAKKIKAGGGEHVTSNQFTARIIARKSVEGAVMTRPANAKEG